MALGYKVELPFGWAYLKANGTVVKLNDGFVPGTADHRLSACFKFKQEAEMEMCASVAYEISATGWTITPKIYELMSIDDSGKEGESLTFAAGDMIRIKGASLSFDSTDTKVGVFFADTSTKAETRCTKYHNIGTNVVDCYLPASIVAESYKVKVVTRPGKERTEEYTFSVAVTVK